MKKTLSLLLVLAMVLSSFGFAFAAEDEIVPAEFLNEKGILKGNASGDLMLEENLKRQDMIIMLSRLLGVEEEAKAYEGETTFTDIADPFYVPYIAWAEAEELTEGVGDNKFGFDRAVKENEVAAFLLRALGYTDVAWEDVPAKAVELGLVEKDVDLTVDAKREVLAELTYKALGMKMKDSEKTLAEHLEIEMPVPEVLEVEEVVADNLKEIKVVFNKAVDESVLDTDNYETDAGEIENIVYVEDENMAILELKNAMKNKKDYELVIDGIKDLAKAEEEFKAYDNEIPVVEDVVALGSHAIKVTMSEPIKNADLKDFSIDGKSVYGNKDIIGRDVIVKIYKAIETGEHEITVKSLEDHAGFKSIESKHTFEVVEDKDAPEVVSVEAPSLEKVIVTFSEDVDGDSINLKTVYYKSSGDKVYPTDKKALAGNKYLFVFEGEKGLPLHETTIYVEGVKDFSGNKMTAAEVAVKAGVDLTRPEIVEHEVSADAKVITLKFNKNVNINDAKFTLLDEDDNKVYITDTVPDGKYVELTLGKALALSKEYTLKITGVKDTNKYANYMADTTLTISASDVGAPTLTLINIKDAEADDVKTYTVTLSFNKAMDFATISDPANYLVDVDGSIKPLTSLDNDIVVKDTDGKNVEIKIYVEKANGSYANVLGIAGLQLKATNGKTLKNYGVVKYVEEIVFNAADATAKATAKDTVKVTFNDRVVEAPKEAFKVNGVQPKEANVNDKVVTLKFENDEVSAKPVEKVTIDGTKVKGLYDTAYTKAMEISIGDEVAPSIAVDANGKKVPATANVEGENLILTVTFDEALENYDATKTDKKEIAKEFITTDLVVIRQENTAEVEFSKVEVEKEKLIITIELTKAELDSVYTVKVLGNGIVKDLAGNIPEALEVSSAKTTEIEAAIADKKAQDAVDAEAAKITDGLTFVVEDADKEDATKVTAAAVTAAQAKVSEGYTVTAKAEGTIDELKLTVTFVVTKNDTEFKAETGELTLTFTAE